MKANGHCLCGSVKFSVDLKSNGVDSCHCSMCRRWSGGPGLFAQCASELNFESTEFVKKFDSSSWAERGFCSNCGTHLFYRLKNGQFLNIPVGLLTEQKGLKFTGQVYVDHKPEYYQFANETHMMTEADVLKAFGFAE